MSRAVTRALVTFAAVTALAAPVARAGAATVEDRYGPPPQADYGLAARAAAPASGWLSWSGKTPAAAQAAPAVQSPYTPSPAASAWSPSPRRAPERIANATLPTSLYSPAPTPRQEAASAAPAAQPAPWTSMGNAARAAEARDERSEPFHPAHFYSVQRQYGLQPDPIPLPKQFFAASTPDLAAPPPPLPPHPVPGSQAATSPENTAANRAREVELETADSAAD